MFQKRRNITPAENAEKVNFNEKLGVRHTIVREPSVVDEFYLEKVAPSDDDKEAVCIVDPIHILFNQQRLDNIGVTAAKSFLDSLAPKSDSLAELRSRCSDDDLLSMIKSRHLQSPAEILYWCRYMQQNLKDFDSEVAKLLAQQQAEQQEKDKQNIEQIEIK